MADQNHTGEKLLMGKRLRDARLTLMLLCLEALGKDGTQSPVFLANVNLIPCKWIEEGRKLWLEHVVITTPERIVYSLTNQEYGRILFRKGVGKHFVVIRDAKEILYEISHLAVKVAIGLGKPEDEVVSYQSTRSDAWSIWRREAEPEYSDEVTDAAA